MVRDREHSGEIGVVERSAEGMHLTAVLLATEACFQQAARAGAGQVARRQRLQGPQAERFQRGQHFCPAVTLHVRQQLEVSLDHGPVHDEARRRHASRVEGMEGPTLDGHVVAVLAALALGADGGYVFAPSHDVVREVPLKNMLAFIEEAQAQPGYRALRASGGR